VSEPTQDPTPDASGQDGEQEDGREGTAFVQVTRRRAPRFRSFALTGLVIAFVLAGGIAVVTPPSDGYSQQALFGYLFCAFGLVFVLLGALVAVLADRRTGTRPEPRRPRGKRSGV
jgi:protein-S-isoprenylcysteine O-methyltransferase Ste14